MLYCPCRLLSSPQSPARGRNPVFRPYEVELTAKVGETVEKTEHTAIHSKRVDGVAQIREIRIGGSKTRIAFD
jgi:hypothetical protein